MARSSTLPLSTPERSTSKKIGRSNTTALPPKSSHIHIPHPHIPHPHNPFSHNGASSKTHTSDKLPTRPTAGAGGLNRQNSVHTRYMTMLLSQDTIPRFHTILAAFFTWILLAGFLVFPGTFTSLQKLEENDSDEEARKFFIRTVKNIPLIYVGAVCCGIGAGGMIWLWWRWRANFVWLLNKIFLPGCLNSFAGLISTLINVYSQQDGHWSTTAWITAAVTGGVMLITGVLFGLYNFWLLEKVKRSHGREMESEGLGHDGEGLKEKVERKTHEPALEPGSVV